MQLNFLQEDLLTAMQKTAPAAPSVSLQKKPAKPPTPVQTSLLADMPPASKKPVASKPAKPQMSAKTTAEEKAPNAFKTISEAADTLGVPTHVLRFWESQFTQISPTKSRGGRRYYRPEDMKTLTMVKHLLYKQGYTIKGARKVLAQMKDGMLDAVPVHVPAAKPAKRVLSDKQKAQLAAIRSELLGLKQQLNPYLA